MVACAFKHGYKEQFFFFLVDMTTFSTGDLYEYGARVGAGSGTLFLMDAVYFGVVSRLFGNTWWYPDLPSRRNGRVLVVVAMIFCAVLFGVVGALFRPGTLADAATVGCLLGILVFGVFNACALVMLETWTLKTAFLDTLYGVGGYTAASCVMWHLL